MIPVYIESLLNAVQLGELQFEIIPFYVLGKDWKVK